MKEQRQKCFYGGEKRRGSKEEKRRKTAVQQQLSSANKTAWYPEEIIFPPPPSLSLLPFIHQPFRLMYILNVQPLTLCSPPLQYPFSPCAQNCRLIYWSLFLPGKNYAYKTFMGLTIRIYLLQQMFWSIKQGDTNFCLFARLLWRF